MKAGAKCRINFKRLSLITCASLAVAIIAYFIIIDQIFRNAFPRALELGFRPQLIAKSAIPEQQIENHTCGLHALRSIYQAHGLPPDDHKLRKRLGIDRPAIPFMHSTQGALQPDICRVLSQDGFLLKLLNLEDDNPIVQLDDHLSKSWKALALIKKPENGALHWIVIEKGNELEFTTVDSQQPVPKLIIKSEFLQRLAITVFLVEPNPKPTRECIELAHRLGIAAMKQTPLRMKKLED